VYSLDSASIEVKNDFHNSFIKFYDIGKKTPYLRVRSAKDKGRSDNRTRILNEALSYPYIQPNTSFNKKCFVFDIDREFDLNFIFDNNLPVPNFVVYNRSSGKAHVWYVLKTPIYIQPQFKTSKAYKYGNAVYSALAKALKADRQFNQRLCKNPFSSEWKTVILRSESLLSNKLTGTFKKLISLLY